MEGLVRDVPLAPMTTLELGGSAELFLDATGSDVLVEALQWARDRDLVVSFLGGGSNLIVPDEGVQGLVVRIASTGIIAKGAELTVQAGEDWDTFVAFCVGGGLAGLECLSGIPGRVGASPVQNVGAYGQDVSETIAAVGVLDLQTLKRAVLTPDQCGFAYRDSAFKRNPDRYLVLDVTFRLEPGGAPAIRYAELKKNIGPNPTLEATRETVVALRRNKSMVLDSSDPNRRSAGSFFTNPYVSTTEAERLVAAALAEGIVNEAEQVPRWPDGDRVKLAAGWLIERAGFAKGTRRGNVGLSTKHALALVHHGGGTTAELLDFAEEIRAGVHTRFGVRLEREPRLLAGVKL